MWTLDISLICRWIYDERTPEVIVAVVVITTTISYIYIQYTKKKKNSIKSEEGEEEEEEEEEDIYEDVELLLPNVAFYENKIRSKPNGDFIETMLKWKGDYYVLEENHSYVQWLFPNRMDGRNRHAYTLQDEEAEIISKTPELRARGKRAFEMMLDFYGMRLTKNNQFELAENSEERLKELNEWGNHNFFRISRILIALKGLGHVNLMQPWMKFLADLIYREKVLHHAKSSFEDYWLDTLDAADRIELDDYIKVNEYEST